MSKIRGIYVNPALRVVQEDTIENNDEVIADEIGANTLCNIGLIVGGHRVLAICEHDMNKCINIGVAVRTRSDNGRCIPVVYGVAFIVGIDDNFGRRSLTDVEAADVLAHIKRTKRNLYLLV